MLYSCTHMATVGFKGLKCGDDPAIFLRSVAILVKLPECPYLVTFDLTLTLSDVKHNLYGDAHGDCCVSRRTSHFYRRHSISRQTTRSLMYITDCCGRCNLFHAYYLCLKGYADNDRFRAFS